MIQPVCGICHNQATTTRQMYCPACAIQSSLGLRIRLINSQSEVAQLTAKIDEIIGSEYTYNKAEGHTDKSSSSAISSLNAHTRYTEPLDIKVRGLRAHIDRMRKAEAVSRKKTAIIQSHTQQLLDENRQKSQELAQSKSLVYKQHDTRYQQTMKSTSLSLIKTNEETLMAINTLRDKYTHDLVVLFSARRRRRRKGRVSANSKAIKSNSASSDEVLQPASPDLIMGFAVLPDFSFLPNYSHPTINAALERLAYFIVLLGYYLDVRLPFDISLPNRHQARPRISHPSRNVKHELFFPSGTQVLAQQKPKVFEEIVEGLAMLTLNLDCLALHLGIERRSFKQVAEVNTLTALIHDRLAPEESILKGTDTESTTEPDEIDLDSLTNYIVSQTYFEINGASGEWNIVDKVLSDNEGDD